MKTYFIFLCLLISACLASATTQTAVNQDKPARLYVKSYGMGDSGSYNEVISFDTQTWNLTFNGNVNWSDGSAGTGSWTSRVEDITLLWDDTCSVNASWHWPVSSWPNLSATVTVTYLTETYYYPPRPPYSYGFTNTSTGQTAPVFWEHCDMDVESNYYDIYGGQVQTTERRTAQATLKLQTGGKATSKLRNLFCLSGSAQQINPNNTIDANPYNGNVGYIYEKQMGAYFPPQNISIGSYGNLNSSGVLYKILPDNADVDVTPYVAGADYYTFSVSAQKYHSYFDLYVQQANPGYSYMPYGTNDVGHAFWRFSTEAPNNALQYISASLTNFLSHSMGFYPSNGLFTVPGQVRNDDAHPANIHRKFYIGFPDLINGLEFTRGISNAPPIYSLTGYNCVSAARNAGCFAGVHAVPEDVSPQNFGVTLVLYMYPGPFLDNTDIFYSIY